MDSLRLGFLGVVVLCKSGVRAKFGVNMGSMEEFELSRLVKEERTGPGWKHSRQKLLRRTIVGLHLLVGDSSQPDQDSRTPPYFLFFYGRGSFQEFAFTMRCEAERFT